jgi:hypothetical protein
MQKTTPHRLITTLAVLSAAAAPTAAHAYIGPGAGLSAIGSLLALIAAVFVAIFGFLWYPIKSWRKRRQAAAGPAEPVESASSEATTAARESAEPETSERR